MIYERTGKTSYKHSQPIKFWIGAYICCGKINQLLANGEPNHTFTFTNVGSAIETNPDQWNNWTGSSAQTIVPVKPVVRVTTQLADDIGGDRFAQTISNVSYNTSNMFSFNDYITFNFGPKNNRDEKFVLGFTSTSPEDVLAQPLLWGYRTGDTMFAIGTDNSFYGYKHSRIFKKEATQYFVVNHKHKATSKLGLDFTTTVGTATAKPTGDTVDVERSIALGFSAVANFSINQRDAEFLVLSLSQPLRIEKGRIEFTNFIADIEPTGREMRFGGTYGKNYNKKVRYWADASYTVDKNNISGMNDARIMFNVKWEG